MGAGGTWRAPGVVARLVSDAGATTPTIRPPTGPLLRRRRGSAPPVDRIGTDLAIERARRLLAGGAEFVPGHGPAPPPTRLGRLGHVVVVAVEAVVRGQHPRLSEVTDG